MAEVPGLKAPEHYKELEHKIVKLSPPWILEGETAQYAIVVIQHKKLVLDDSIVESRVIDRQPQWGESKQDLIGRFTSESAITDAHYKKIVDKHKTTLENEV